MLRRVTKSARYVRAFATTAEDTMKNTLISALKATHVKVDDISGGCGSMYQIEVVSPEFEGKNRVAQHRLVNAVSSMHLYIIANGC